MAVPPDSNPAARTKPAKCPIVCCPTTLSEPALLQHLLSDHSDINSETLREGKHCKLLVQEEAFPRGQPICLKILLYGGEKHCLRPARSGLSPRQNLMLHSEHSCYKDHLAVLLMGCKTNRMDMIAEGDVSSTVDRKISQLRERAENDSDPEKDIFVLWLIGTETTWPIYGDLTVRSSGGTFSLGDRVQVKDFTSFTQPKLLLSEGVDYILIIRGAMNLLTDGDLRGDPG
ncbi:uncharacterized protein LOC131693332 [Topomyia yanbarensis]|uniref:uncharacterized protein LOC131693332 n=1 Tax=Topomyia yanbarensis TaxID=2498891 RepID=UPI00273AC3A5|nr:uncharacterized protein LOC131693332 [Topomyia yanbarensis]